MGEMKRPMHITLVAIAGGSGAGKSWLARELQRRLRPHAARLALDDFYRDLSEAAPAARARLNFDAPGALDWPLFTACLERIRAGAAVRLPRYDFATHARRPEPRRWRPRPVVLIEGLWPYWRRELKGLYALRIFKAGPPPVRFARRLDRDVRERGRTEPSVRAQWLRQVAPMEARFVRPQARWADVVLPAEVPEWRLDRIERQIRTLAKVGRTRRASRSRGGPNRPALPPRRNKT